MNIGIMDIYSIYCRSFMYYILGYYFAPWWRLSYL